MTSGVSVIVPAFNNWPLTEACIDTLLNATAREILADVIVVDDGSTDGVSSQWTAAQREITPVLLPVNRGFSQACNAGASAAQGDVLLFLNNDAFVRSTSIAAMLATLRADPSIGIVGAKLLYADGTLQHAGLALLDGSVSRWWHVHRHLPGSLPDADVGRDLLAITGAAFMITRPLFDALGGFDNGYTNGWEDVDLCLRSWSRGKRVRYEPRAVIEHLESATLGRKHDDTSNEQRFIGRWAAILAPAPRYPLAEIPPLALAADLSSVIRASDGWALEHVRQTWRSNFGAHVELTRPGSRFDRAKLEVSAALAKRRPTLEIAWAGAAFAKPTGPLRIAFVAPLTLAEARTYAKARAVTAWWTPSVASRDALVGAGIAAGCVSVIPLGAGAVQTLSGTHSLGVAAREEDADLLHELTRRTPQLRTSVLRSGIVPDLQAVDIFVTRHGGDRWGLSVPAALAHGCHVIASPPLDAFVAGTRGVTVVDDALLLDAVLERSADVPRLRAAASAVQLAARRRLDASLATRHAAEAARAIVHGTPSAALAQVGPALAAHLAQATLKVHV